MHSNFTSSCPRLPIDETASFELHINLCAKCIEILMVYSIAVKAVIKVPLKNNYDRKGSLEPK